MLYRKVQIQFRHIQAKYFKGAWLVQETGSLVAAVIRRCMLDKEYLTIIHLEQIRDMCREVNAIGNTILKRLV